MTVEEYVARFMSRLQPLSRDQLDVLEYEFRKVADTEQQQYQQAA